MTLAWRLIARFAVIALALLEPAPLSAQAFCSAPHSTPSLSRAGAGTLPPGTGWLQVGGYHSRSTRFFGPDGGSRPFLAGGASTTNSVFVTAAAGVLHDVELWAQIPVHRLEFADAAGDRSRVGFGDPRLALRVGADVAGFSGVPLTLRAGVKFPGSRFPVDPDLLPLSEGQTDFELAVESGGVLPSTAVHVVGWLGYRWRGRDDRRARKPGDEWFAQLGLGGPVQSFQWELAVEGLRGGPLEQHGLELRGASRRLVQIVPTVGYGFAGKRVEVSARLNAWGRNLPTGAAWTASVLVPWSW